MLVVHKFAFRYAMSLSRYVGGIVICIAAVAADALIEFLYLPNFGRQRPLFLPTIYLPIQLNWCVLIILTTVQS